MIRSIQFSDYDKVKELVESVHMVHVKNRPDVFSDAMEKLLGWDYFRDIVNNSMSFVYTIGDVIVGLVIAFEHEHKSRPGYQDRKFCIIEVFVVADDYRNQGIGHLLYDHIVDVCREKDIDGIELGCYAFNKKARDFYEELGLTLKSVRYEQIL